jgi:polyribonucleotide nucleotidyltransferase
VLANVVVKSSPEERDFFPLTVDFEDKWYATGKYPDLDLSKEKDVRQS